MKKQREREILDMVFGGHDVLEVTEHENPDFRCTVGLEWEFGVEVTEFFYSESAARLRRIPGYARELLGQARYRHKNDKRRIRVEDVIYRSAGTGRERKIKAVLGETYTLGMVIDRLKYLIENKNQRSGDYARNISPVDLIICDVDRASGCDGIEVLIRAIGERNATSSIKDSGFREIYVVTSKAGELVCVPLKANLFVAEVHAFQRIFKEYHGNDLPRVRFVDFIEALAIYLTRRFNQVQYEVDRNKRLRLVFGSVACSYSERGALEIHDVSFESGTERTGLMEELGTDTDTALQEHVESERKQMFCCVPLCFKARG